MALNVNPILPADGTLVITDGAALTLTLPYTDGDLSVSGMKEGDYAVELFSSRGDIFSARQTNQEPVSVSFSCILTEVSDLTEQTTLDAMLKAGAFAAATSVIAGSDVWACKLTYTYDTSGAGGDTGTIAINTFIPGDTSFAEGTPAKLSISGQGIPIGGVAAVTRT